MLIKKPEPIAPSEITPEAIYRERRRFLGLGAALAVTAASGTWLRPTVAAELPKGGRFERLKVGPFATKEVPTPYEDVTHYNNFYEFGTAKTQPAVNALNFQTDPWSVTIDGEVGKPGKLALEDLLKPVTLEERIYRLRCVEGWSMVIPWVGFPLADLLKRFEPTSRAKFVKFTTLFDPEQMPWQSRDILPWPYVEGLRMDEAMHPLTILAVGLYGRVMPNQNGAPIRLVVPWKYGFKSIKSIVRITLTEQMPETTWHRENPHAYGLYSNVNPHVDHPRWSQARERRIGEFFKRDTLMFNGYGEQVASLYKGMDLRKYF